MKLRGITPFSPLVARISVLLFASLLGLTCGGPPQPASRQTGLDDPNPFFPTMTISYSLADTCHVTIVLYNVEGQVMDTLVNERQAPGEHSYDVTKAEDFASFVPGVYFYHLTACKETVTKKLVLVK